MATEISFGDANTGFQGGIGNGPVNHYAPPERVETPPCPSIVIPFSRDQDFVDRGTTVNRETTVDQGTIIDQIIQKCRRPGSRTALVGLGGVGKSQLAIEYAYRIREQSPETWVFWIHASNTARFEQSIRDVADCAKIYGRQNPKANIFQLVHGWLYDKTKGPWVLILDNLDNASFLTSPSGGSGGGSGSQAGEVESTGSRPLLSYIPHCQHGSILITSRSRSVASEVVEEADLIEVESMNVNDAVTLFGKKFSGPISDDAFELVTTLVALLEYMPLAIAQAAAYIFQRWPRCSFKQYLDDYQASDRKKAGLLSYEGGKLRRDANAKNSILITWQISFDHIRQVRRSAADLLSVMSFCDRQGIPEMLLHNQDPTNQRSSRTVQIEGRGEAEDGEAEDEDPENEWRDDDSTEIQSDKNEDDGFEDDISVLRNYSFVTANEDGCTFEMHRLVQLATLEWLELHEQKEQWRHRFLTKLCKEIPTGEHKNWALCRMLFPHAQSAAAQIPKTRDSRREWATVLHRAAWYCLEAGNRTEAERLAVSAMKVRKKLFEADDEEVLRAMAMVAWTYSNQGRWEEAEKLDLQVMETRKTKLRADHPDTLTSMENLASTYIEQGRWLEAEKLNLQVMETRKMKLGTDHPDTLTVMGNLAWTYRSQGRWEEAEKLEVQVMETFQTKLGASHPDTLTSMGNLALTYSNLGRWEEAEKLEVQVMETRKTKLGADHPDTLTITGNLAWTYWNQGQWEEAEKLFLQVMETFQTQLGADHPDTLTIMANLAFTYWSQDRYTEAVNLMSRCIKGQSVKLGIAHPEYRKNAAALARWESKLSVSDAGVSS
ncbi:Kinesin light chain [Paramyrothecium foliicola]|nr:Kinesin light chain [Paramyrothecium foliicola]